MSQSAPTTRVTTAASRGAVAASWLVAAAVGIGGLLLVRWRSGAAHGPLGARPAEVAPARRPARADLRSRQPLPPEHARKMLDSSEVLVKRELRERLRRFEAMAAEVRRKQGGLLDRIEARPVPAGVPAEVNDTSAARGVPRAVHPPPAGEPSVRELYQWIAMLEAEIQAKHLAAEAAARALRRGLSFPEVLGSMRPSATRMPAYQALAAAVNAQHGIGGDAMPIRSVEDINRYRDLLGQTTRQSGLAESRLLGMVGSEGRALGTGTGRPGGQGTPGGGELGHGAPGWSAKPLLPHDAKFADERMVSAQALPGRRFSRASARRGWLYVNTWYMIGPWDSYGRNDYSITHPPEQGIDLDAVYHGGRTGPATEETDAHPLHVSGREVMLDGTLRWKFMQSESMHNTVPATADDTTCYAFTELYFDEPVMMVVAIGTDDSGKLWINGREIWQDEGYSWYHIDEHIEAFPFQQGWNRVLIRLDNNGGAATGFSFLICPQEAAAAGPGQGGGK